MSNRYQPYYEPAEKGIIQEHTLIWHKELDADENRETRHFPQGQTTGWQKEGETQGSNVESGWPKFQSEILARKPHTQPRKQEIPHQQSTEAETRGKHPEAAGVAEPSLRSMTQQPLLHQKGHCAVDLIQEPNQYRCLFDLPGVEKHQVSLHLDRGVLKMIVRRTEDQIAEMHQGQQMEEPVHREKQPEAATQNRNAPQHNQPQSSTQNQPQLPQQSQTQSSSQTQTLPEANQPQGGSEYEKPTMPASSQQGVSEPAPRHPQSTGTGANTAREMENAAKQMETRTGQESEQPISQEKAAEAKAKQSKGFYLVKERSHGRIERFVRLPWDIKEENIDAKLENGVLTVAIGRTPRARHVQVA